LSKIEAYLSKRFKFATNSKTRRDLFRQLQQSHQLVLSLNNKESRTVENSSSRPSTEFRDSVQQVLKRGRRFSFILHNTLSRLWGCTCHRFGTAMMSPRRTESASEDPFFSVVFTFEYAESVERWGYQEIEIHTHQRYGCPRLYLTNSQTDDTSSLILRMTL